MSIDEHFIEQVTAWSASTARLPTVDKHRASELLSLFDAQAQSRQLDFAARQLQQRGKGFYTIGSAGHESNAAVAMALRPTDPALLHYRSGGFYVARAMQVPGSTPARDVLQGVVAAANEPIAGGRHKVFGNRSLHVIPQTSTIASHLPRAVGLAMSLKSATEAGVENDWPADAVIVCTFGDASANHSTAAGALNAAAYCAHRRIDMPIMFVCEDNGIGISTKTPAGWMESALQSYPDLAYVRVDGTDPEHALTELKKLSNHVRSTRSPGIVHLKTVRFMGHAGSDAELGYRSRSEIVREYAADPLLHTARCLVDRAVLSPESVLDRYEQVRRRVADEAAEVAGERHLMTAQEVVEPLAHTQPAAVAMAAQRSAEDRNTIFNGRLPEDAGPLTLGQAINAALTDTMGAWPQAFVFGEDVSTKGGVYGITRGLRKRFTGTRVFDTILDEQTILGTALGAALAGLLPIPEIQYLAYVHNAEDQLRGEAATLRFFSNGQYDNGMVVRIAGLAYQKGFGGHFHNDNSVAALRDIPGLVLAVPSHPADAPALLRTCVALAQAEGRVCVFLEPIALYHNRDLHAEGDEQWMAPYDAPHDWSASGFLRAASYLDGRDLLIVTFGNGVFMSLRAAQVLRAQGIDATVLDLRWLSPLPVEDLLAHACDFDRVLVADETRKSGGVSESVITALVDGDYTGLIERVASVDSYVPLGPAAEHVLLSEDDIIQAAQKLARPFTGFAEGSA